MGMKGDFLSFSFNDRDSSEFNIIRTSDGDRFDEELTPEIKDVTVEVPGMDGEYFFGSTYGPRTFEVSFAYDSLTESQFRELRKVYGQRRMGELIFSERPYKKYIAKIESPIELSYICFDEPKRVVGTPRAGVRVASRTPITEEVDGVEQIVGYSIEREQVTPYEYQEGTQRIYKGEGKISFTAYYPFAKSCFKVLDTDELKNSDWAVSSGILTAEIYNSQNIDKYSDGQIKVYNPGDLPTGFRFYLPMSAASHQIVLSYQSAASDSNEPTQLVINPVTAKPYDIENNNPVNDVGILIDTNNGLIIGVKSMSINQQGNAEYETSGNLYNEYVESGTFFKLQPDAVVGESILSITGDAEGCKIFYDYLYF